MPSWPGFDCAMLPCQEWRCISTRVPDVVMMQRLSGLEALKLLIGQCLYIKRPQQKLDMHHIARAWRIVTLYSCFDGEGNA